MNETVLKSTTDEKFMNMTEFVFGKNFINDDMRLDSDLSKHANLDRVDGGRYVLGASNA